MIIILFFIYFGLSSPIPEFTLEAPYTTLIKNWKKIGKTNVINDTIIELTPDTQSVSGLIVSRKRIPIKSFKMEITLQMTSNKEGKHADGIALWFTQSPLKTGKAFGASNKWKGISVIFDTFQNGKMEVPTAQMIMNFNNKEYKGETDGIDIMSKSCYFGSYRGNPFTVYFEYNHDTHEINLDLQQQGKEKVNCFKGAVFKMDIGQYFGISASNGDLSDSHRLISVKMTDPKIKIPKRKEYKTKEPETEELKLEPIVNTFNKEELNKQCNDNEKCKIIKVYTTLGNISDELALNIKLAKERNEVLNKIYERMEKTSKSVTYLRSSATVLKTIHDIQDDEADKVSDFFTSIGDLMDKITTLGHSFYSSNNQYEKVISLTLNDYFIFTLQLILFIGVLFYTLLLYSNNRNRVI
ncbi:vesicular integral-membrane protein VIP36 precursor, putative [Entamoeba dispar SAW760]|uniref:Vesicular integral-membrane protein VIP36, putative n=1 Tax=Entamoeba dispar (strain ATCC PRA-260 / SAW760) TaxID=370354 RepID=B0EH30_ENTDS|nr:vesicular integral-membrane protein VIP36 precursor, putative [Entamoeba dispar SAW760]EDR26167.1 vesicular integral-membrane protein VIP36 precursor, putative [Entamoeba dispar SAW760]|eukprot:EDR26167.1 vesicular integral-membrane protein VIP36 precursor, putative [Entamoeba dispar SAW760]